MACPHVTGTVALILSTPESFQRDLDGDGIPETNGDGTWTPGEVRKVLHATARDLGPEGWDEWYGYELVDANRSIYVGEVHDLSIANIYAPSSVARDEDVTILVEVANQGTKRERSTVRLLLVDGGESRLLGSGDVEVLPANSVNASFRWHVDVGTGVYTLKAEVDPVRGEEDVSDNSGTLKIEVQERVHDLGIEELEVPQRVTAGQTALIRVRAKNYGNVKENSILKVFVEGELLEERAVSLEPGAEEVQDFSWDTEGLAPGEYNVTAYIVPVDGEEKVSNNRAEKVVVIEEVKSLQVDVSTNKDSYRYLDLAWIKVRVSDPDGKPVMNAHVVVEVVTAGGYARRGSSYTDSNGVASFAFRIYPWYGGGTYTVKAVAVEEEYQQGGSASFNVRGWF